MDDIITAAAEACNGLTRLANKVGTTKQVLTHWRNRGVPVERCAELEVATGGVVRRWDMRPDDWHIIWPELVGADGAPGVGGKET